MRGRQVLGEPLYLLDVEGIRITGPEQSIRHEVLRW